MMPPGIDAYKLRKKSKSKIYAHEQKNVKFSAAYKQQFVANKKSREFFNLLPPSYRKQAINWVMSAKREETQIKRIKELIAEGEKGPKVKVLRRQLPKKGRFNL